MTIKTMKLSNHTELKALDTLAKHYKVSHLSYNCNNVYGYDYAPMKEIHERFIAIHKSLVANGADSSKASKFVNSYENIASLYYAPKHDVFIQYENLYSYQHKLDYLNEFSNIELKHIIERENGSVRYNTFKAVVEAVMKGKEV